MSSGFGIVLQTGDPLADVGDLTDLGFPKMNRDVIEASSFDSPGGFKEFVANGLIDAGEMSVTFKWRDATSGAAVKAAFDSGAVTPFAIATTHSTPIGLAFNGIVKSWEPETSSSDQMTITSTIKLTGAPVWS